MAEIPDGRPHHPAGSSVSPGSLRQQPQNILEGRITHVERYDERPRTDGYKVMAGILIGLVVIIPFGALFIASGILSFSFAFLGFSSLSQLFNPIVWMTSFFELLEVMVLRRMNRADILPVYRGIVEDSNGREHAFMFRGPLNLGNLVVGHHVRLSGDQREGTLVVRQGYDGTTRTAISSGYRNPWKTIFFCILGLGATVAMLAFLFFNGIMG